MAGVDAENVIFNKAVNFVLPHAIPTHLDRSGEYKLGDILVFEKKLRPLMPWRKHRLVFTGANITKLLSESVDISSSVEQIFDNTSISRTFGEDAKVNAEIQYAMAHLGVNVAETEYANMSVDFGKIERHFSNLSGVLRQQTEKRLRVSTTDPVIQDAMTHSRTLFIINSLYVAEKAVVSLSFTNDGKDTTTNKQQPAVQSANPPTTTTDSSSAATTTTTTPTTTTTAPTVDAPTSNPPTTTTLVKGVGANINLALETTGKSVVERSVPTNIGYRVMRIKLGSHGALLPQLRAAVRHIKVKFMDETDFVDASNVVDARNQAEDECDYTHDQFDVMAAREDEP